MPKTRLGKYSFRLLLGFVFLFAVAQILVISGQRGGETFFDNLWLSIPMSLAFLCAIASFVVGIMSIVRDNERSPLVLIASLIGFVVLFFLGGEFLFPH
jgi:cytochrome bd-type quinol oxidase subunit 2